MENKSVKSFLGALLHIEEEETEKNIKDFNKVFKAIQKFDDCTVLLFSFFLIEFSIDRFNEQIAANYVELEKTEIPKHILNEASETMLELSKIKKLIKNINPITVELRTRD